MWYIVPQRGCRQTPGLKLTASLSSGEYHGPYQSPPNLVRALGVLRPGASWSACPGFVTGAVFVFATSSPSRRFRHAILAQYGKECSPPLAGLCPFVGWPDHLPLRLGDY